MFGLLAALMLGQQAAASSVPAVLAPYIKDGRFDPGDYGWARGRFDDASPVEKAQFATVRNWLDRCHEDGRRQMRSELAALGIVDARLDRVDFRDALCAQVASMPDPIDTRSFAVFVRAVTVARPVAETYLLAVRIAETTAWPSACMPARSANRCCEPECRGARVN